MLILGGRENALSLTRSLGRLGITVRVSGPSDCWGMHSRHCAQALPVPSGTPAAAFWGELLLGHGRAALAGSLLAPCSDDAIDFVARNRAALEPHYRFDHSRPELALALLDKSETLTLAARAGVATPQRWAATGEADLEAMRDALAFPVMVKPIISHEFYRVFGRKLFIVESGFDELAARLREVWAHAIPVMVVEMIPGPDSLLSSFYTYIDAEGAVLFRYTKRIIRRYPVNRGLACYHASQWLPETAAAGEAFFRGIGFTGLGNIEFKRDLRDGRLKVIESNARFTAAQELVIRSGAPIDLIWYCAATGQPGPRFTSYRQDLTYWYGLRDTLAFLELARSGRITVREWLGSLSPLRNVQPLHALSDPMPTLGAVTARLGRTLAMLR